MWTTDNMPDLSGRKAIVTGANAGIGFEIAKALYAKGASVTLGVRDAVKGQLAIDRIKSQVDGNGELCFQLLDLSDLYSVGSFADEFLVSHIRLDILVNNAGVMVPPASSTADGHELQFGVNFLGHFALTGRLMPLLLQTSRARVVTLSSGAATLVKGIDFENLKFEKPYDPWREYAVSKLADLVFTYELQRRLKATKANVISVAAHPGVTRTELQRNIPQDELQGLWGAFEQIMQPWQGALPPLFAATDMSVSGGEFYGPDGKNEYSGYPSLSQHQTDAINDTDLALELWQYAEQSTKITFNFGTAGEGQEE